MPLSLDRLVAKEESGLVGKLFTRLGQKRLPELSDAQVKLELDRYERTGVGSFTPRAEATADSHVVAMDSSSAANTLATDRMIASITPFGHRVLNLFGVSDVRDVASFADGTPIAAKPVRKLVSGLFARSNQEFARYLKLT